ncbi:MAG: hypothetical protein HC836_22610 [Richelia sp. RM2_1_2]|nr:hypothetical protein [Richelia sp. RM2_1_2]
MAKKEYKTAVVFEFFNQRAPKKNAELTAQAIEEAAGSSLASYTYERWVTVDKLAQCLSKAWDYDMNDYHFRRWWLDQLVNEWGYLIWNVVFNTQRKTVDDKKADQIASDIKTKFLKNFS